MKKLIINIIKLYQVTPLHTHSMCRYIPTCSEYMIIAIDNHGVFKGILLGIKRILKCHPLGGKGIDMVPFKEEKWKKFIYLV